MSDGPAADRVSQLEAEVAELRRRLARSERALLHSEWLTALRQLISGVAQELANPLTAVIARASLIGAARTLDDARRHAAIIEEQGHRATKIVGNLSSFVRRRGDERSAFSVNRVVQAVVDVHGYQLQASNITLLEDLEDGLSMVEGDAHQMEQVVLNLLMNAQHAMVHGRAGGRLTVRTRGVPECVRVIVEDDGPGIPADQLEQVFEPFFTTKGEEGTGLGLAVSRQIVAAHGGRIWAETVPGGGARVVVELPACAVAPSDGTAAPPPPPESSRRSFLVVDDEPDLGRLIVAVLQRRGYRAEYAPSAIEALERVRRETFDGILTDIRMPIMSGDELWRCLAREHPELAQRTVFMTGHFAAAEVARLLEETGRPCLTKPFQFAELDTVLARLGTEGAGPDRPEAR